MGRVAITGGTGFVGRHLAARLDDPVVVSRRTGVAIDDEDALAAAFAGCETVVHCAGINRELREQTFQRVHVVGTRAVVAAAQRAGVRRIVMLSFVLARPGSGSPYHETKWIAEEAVRASGLEYAVLKAGMIYGHGDHLVDHLTRSVRTQPFFATVGLRGHRMRPIPVAELVDLLVAAAGGRVSGTVTVLGAESLTLSTAVRRVAAVVGRPVIVLPAPVWAVRALGWATERTMVVPLVALAQVRMLADGVDHGLPGVPGTDSLPSDLYPTARFDRDHIAAAVPDEGAFGVRDLLRLTAPFSSFRRKWTTRCRRGRRYGVSPRNS